MKKRTFVTVISVVTIVEVVVALVVLGVVLKQNITVPLFITAAFLIAFGVVYFSLDSMHVETSKQIEQNVDSAYKEVLNHGDVEDRSKVSEVNGELIYDDGKNQRRVHAPLDVERSKTGNKDE